MARMEFMYDIIIVDSDPMVSYINSEHIKFDGRFRVAGEFRDAKEALRFMEEKPAGLVLLELELPGYSGLDMMRDMLAKGIYADVIAVTASREGSALAQALRLGVMDYIIKPYTQDRLRKALDKFADYTAAAREIKMAGQETVDYLLAIGDSAFSEKNETEQRIMRCFEELGVGGLTAKDFVNKLELSIVTVRRYLKRLVDAGRLIGEMDYGTGGHPRVIYHLPTGMNGEG